MALIDFWPSLKANTAISLIDSGRRKIVSYYEHGAPSFILHWMLFDLDEHIRMMDEAGIDVAWYTTRERGEAEVLPWDHLDSGLDKEWLWADWQDALDEQELDDCRWTPCFDCGVCPSMGTDIQVGPTGKTLLPLSVV